LSKTDEKDFSIQQNIIPNNKDVFLHGFHCFSLDEEIRNDEKFFNSYVNNSVNDNLNNDVNTIGTLFESLMTGIDWETTGKGRLGAVLVKQNQKGETPIVRTTTKYEKPTHLFSKLHIALANKIFKKGSGILNGKKVDLNDANEVDLNNANEVDLMNNALIECYKEQYKTMGFHSDQAQDLEENTAIFIYSCYKNPEDEKNHRKLVIEEKDDSTKVYEIPMRHNSVICFSLDTNKKYRHKIELSNYDTRGTKRKRNNKVFGKGKGKKSVKNVGSMPNESFNDHQEWLGLTFRTSKFFVNSSPLLTIATKKEQEEFYRLRKRENNETDFVWPDIGYTISPSDLLEPVLLEPV